MKNRRITIVAFLLIAALTLGFGYAAVTNVLDIQGSASVSATAAEAEFNENVYLRALRRAMKSFNASLQVIILVTQQISTQTTTTRLSSQ